jgi:hypothetical protein
MSIPFSGIITPGSLTFTGTSGKTFTVTDSNPSFPAMVAKFKEIKAAKAAGFTAEANRIHEELTTLAQPAKRLVVASKGSIAVVDGVVTYKGQPVHNAVADRILWGLGEGHDMTAYVSFLDNLMSNPSRRAVNELYGFLDKHKMGISDDGFIIAYKKVRENYHDIYTGKFDHSVGKVLEMPRNEVDDDASRTCSYGFHFCAFSYLAHFGSGRGDKVVIVKVNPADVVSIPADYNDAKARTCKYEVIGEYQGDDLQDVLGNRAVWATQTFSREDWADYSYDEDGFDDECDEDEDEVIREGLDIEALRYVYDSEGEVTEIEITWEDGLITTAEERWQFEEVSEILEEQSERGVRARVRVISGNRSILG